MFAGRLTQATLRALDWLAARTLSPDDTPAHLRIGRRGEEDAYFYLRRQGYTIIARNYRSPHHRGELDLPLAVGVAALAIGMANLWPSLRVVGIDPWEPSLELARQNVAAAGLGDRIELRRQTAEDLADAEAFDLIWIAGPFIPPDVLNLALQRAWHALRPGAWVLMGTFNMTGEPLVPALVRLRTRLCGGQFLVPSEVQGLLEQAGFGQVRQLPSPPWVPMLALAGRRP